MLNSAEQRRTIVFYYLRNLPTTRFWSFLGLLWSDTDQNVTGRFLPVSPSFLAGPEPPETRREGENRVQSSYLKFQNNRKEKHNNLL